MDRFDGTAARQLELIAEPHTPATGRRLARPKPTLRLLRKDIYAELARRRRRAQIKARHLIESR